MLEVVNSVNGSLLHTAPHVYHTILDLSGVPAPQISYNGIPMYIPAYTEKGPTYELPIFEGSKGYADLLNTCGIPNVSKYGLPYSAAVEHARLGGTVVLQPLKAPSATHSAVIIMMKITKSDVPQKLGWIFIPGGKGKGLKTVRRNGVDVQIPESMILNLGSPDEDTSFADPLVQQFIADSRAYQDSPFDKEKLKKAKRLPLPEETSPEYSVIKAKNDQIDGLVEAFVAQWKPVTIPALKIDFEEVDILKEAARLFESPSSGLRSKNGIVSWDSLEAFVNNLGEGSYSQAMQNIEAGAGFTYKIPIIWGMCKGKGKYGNHYIIKFNNTKGQSEGGRPIMQASIWDIKRDILVPNSKKAVSLTNDFVLGQPLLLDSVYSKHNFGGDFKFSSANAANLDDAGAIIGAFLKKSFNDFVLQAIDGGVRKNVVPALNMNVSRGNGSVLPSYGVNGDRLIKEMKEMLSLFDENDDSTIHRLANLDLTKLDGKIGLVNSGGIQDYTFNGGHEGEFKYMKEFDWNFNFLDKKLVDKYGHEEDFKYYQKMWTDEDGKVANKIVQELFRDAFSGKLNPEIFSLYANPAKYILDLDYPMMVKDAMALFGTSQVGQSRDDIILNFTTSVRNTDLDQIIGQKNMTNYQGRNCYYWPFNFEWIDPFSSRSVRVPETFIMIPKILDFYKNGFSKAIAGVDRGALTSAIPGSIRGAGNMTLTEKDKLIDNGINIVSVYKNGMVYLDSQMANYKLDERSSLQEFHNNAIANEILKECYLKLQKYKHMLTSENSVKLIQDMINRDLEKFKSKVESFQYSASFASGYDKAIGQLTHEIGIKFYNTIKYHHIKLTALPIG